MVKLRQKSKRQPVRLRHKIEKASAAKQRKQRKEAKRNPQWKSRLRKDPGIPNLFPFKDKILQELEEKKQLKAEESARFREESRLKNKSEALSTVHENTTGDDEKDTDGFVDLEMSDNESNPMAAFLASAQARAVEFDDSDGANSVESNGLDENIDGDDADIAIIPPETHSAKPTSYLHADSSRIAFGKVFKQIIAISDIILYVLDARDPSGTRSEEVERQIIAAEAGSKRLVLVLNKCDLVPPAVLKGWLAYLRCFFPIVPIQASISVSNSVTFTHKYLAAKRSSETLLSALKSYAKTQASGCSIAVGVIGYPNVGKSSVINSLLSCVSRGNPSACPTGAEAGVTTGIREVKLDNKLKLLDSPGIVFPSENALLSKSDVRSRLILLNALPPKQIIDPIPAVSLLLQRLSSSPSLYEKLLGTYGCPALTPSADGDVTMNFLIQVARKTGRLGKGGVPNVNAAAMTVITDWRDGRVQGWIEPPPLPGSSKPNGGLEVATGSDGSGGGSDQKKIVTEWAKEFKLEGLWGDESTESEASRDP